jgi:hypothetical protein
LFCDAILELALKYLIYDPNFIDNMEYDTKFSYGEEDE